MAALRASRVLQVLLLITLKPWLFRRYGVRITGDRSLQRLRPPFVVLSNHANFWDPFLVAFAFRHPLHLVAADGNYRSRVMRFLMGLAGAIPKAKARNDMESIRAMQELVRSGHAIGFFPEGQRTWDGTTRPLLPGAEKLVRILGAPVVVTILKGAYLAKPRWARAFRRGTVEIELRLLLTGAAVRRGSRRETATAIADALKHDDVLWLQERHRQGLHVRFTGSDRAEGAETVLFLCPVCGGWDSLRSHGDSVSCSVCQARTGFLPSGTLHGGPFRTVREWNAHQLSVLHRLLTWDNTGQAGEASGSGPLPCVAHSVPFLTGYRSRPLRPRGSVRVELTGTHLGLAAVSGDTTLSPGWSRTIPLSEISGLTVQYTHQLEFYAAGKLHVLRIHPPGPSAYRFEQTILAITALRPHLGE